MIETCPVKKSLNPSEIISWDFFIGKKHLLEILKERR